MMRSVFSQRLLRSAAGALTLAVPCLAAPDAVADGTGAPHEVRLGSASVDWPFAKKRARISAGSSISLGVRSEKRRVRVALVRLGDESRTLKARTLRSGAVKLQMPQRAGRKILVRVSSGSHSAEVRLLTTDTNPCSDAPDPRLLPAAELALSVPSASPGQRITASLRNVGATCLIASPALQWEVLDSSGDYVLVPATLPPSAILANVEPGTSYDFEQVVQPDLAPGTYRARLRADDRSGRELAWTAPIVVTD